MHLPHMGFAECVRPCTEFLSSIGANTFALLLATAGVHLCNVCPPAPRQVLLVRSSPHNLTSISQTFMLTVSTFSPPWYNVSLKNLLKGLRQRHNIFLHQLISRHCAGSEGSHRRHRPVCNAAGDD